jgi:hypothetical protein
MIAFRRATAALPPATWAVSASDPTHAAFARGHEAFVLLNKGETEWDATSAIAPLHIKPGVYVDVLTGHTLDLTTPSHVKAAPKAPAMYVAESRLRAEHLTAADLDALGKQTSCASPDFNAKITCETTHP